MKEGLGPLTPCRVTVGPAIVLLLGVVLLGVFVPKSLHDALRAQAAQ